MTIISCRRGGYARLYPVADGYAFASSYDAALVQELKDLIPTESRRWQPDTKVWLIALPYVHIAAALAEKHLGVTVQVDAAPAAQPKLENRILEVRYLGACRPRGGGESTATGWVGGEWAAIFPEAALREWFEAIPQRPDEMPTLYARLALKENGTPDEIKSAFRRLAKQYHPDVNKEPTAHEDFKSINRAFEVLSDPTKRRKYDAGLKLEAGLYAENHRSDVLMDKGYRSPLRSGFIMCEGKETLGRFVISRIVDWLDIVNDKGETLVSSWATGADHFEERWI